MRVPDYGRGDWEAKYEGNKNLPSIVDIGLRDSTIYISLSEKADSIKVFGQEHCTLSFVANSDSLSYMMKHTDPYARFTAYFPKGEVIYSNAFARFDSSLSTGPFEKVVPKANLGLTILFNLLLLLLALGDILLLYRLIKK